jgi:multidrug resistance efflux pump
MQATSLAFESKAEEALGNAALQEALGRIKTGWQANRTRAAAALPEFEQLRDRGRAIKNHTLQHLDLYLEMFEAKVAATGGHVHFARDAAEARKIVLDICRAAEARAVTKSKSMVAEEIGINDYLEANGIERIETDLDRLIVRSLVAGRVLQVNVRPGEYVGAPPGQPLVARCGCGAGLDRGDPPVCTDGDPYLPGPAIGQQRPLGMQSRHRSLS